MLISNVPDYRVLECWPSLHAGQTADKSIINRQSELLKCSSMSCILDLSRMSMVL